MHQQAAAPHDPTNLDMRQLRHQTKNALVRILAQVSSELSNSGASRRIADDVERRVLLTASISNALFGLTRAPGPFSDRLTELCEAVVELMSDDGQCLVITCDLQEPVPPSHHETLLRVAHEFVGNAVKHGMHVRLVGRIVVKVVRSGAETAMTVADDGWGFSSAPRPGEGMSVSAELAHAVGGRVGLARDGKWTVATLRLPDKPTLKT